MSASELLLFNSADDYVSSVSDATQYSPSGKHHVHLFLYFVP